MAKESEYEGRVLIEEFKKEMNGVIRKNLTEAERSPASIKQ